jgi:hypothetical protein
MVHKGDGSASTSSKRTSRASRRIARGWNAESKRSASMRWMYVCRMKHMRHLQLQHVLVSFMEIAAKQRPGFSAIYEIA